MTAESWICADVCVALCSWPPGGWALLGKDGQQDEAHVHLGYTLTLLLEPHHEHRRTSLGKMNEKLIIEIKKNSIYRLEENLRMVIICFEKITEKDLWNKPSKKGVALGNQIIHIVGIPLKRRK